MIKSHSQTTTAVGATGQSYPSRPATQQEDADLAAASQLAKSCQICFDGDVPLVNCCSSCHAQVCGSCLHQYIRVALMDVIPGILPRVRCPVCLMRINKSAWKKHVPPPLVFLYSVLCASACSFLPPCCHDQGYTHLPPAHTDNPPPPSFNAILSPQLHDKLPALRDHIMRFVKHTLTARELVAFVQAMLGPGCLETLHDFTEDLMRRIKDDERRATLLIGYHATHKLATTRCCSEKVCFNCKRRWDERHDAPGAACDVNEITDAAMLACRSCRMTIVKVEGCDAVTCPCGVSMRWEHELTIRHENERHLVVVDVYDTKLFQAWDAWRHEIKGMVHYHSEPLRHTWRMQKINSVIRQHYSLLRNMLLSYIWHKRFRQSLPALAKEIHRVRMRFLLRKLCRSVRLQIAVRKSLQWMRWQLCLQRICRLPLYDEVALHGDELEMALVGLFE